VLDVTGQPRATIVASTGTTVAVLVALLVVLGVVMIAVAMWLVRSTRSDHPALGPLETMGDRSFRRASTDRQATRLAASRPPGAPDPAPIVPLDDEPEPVPTVVEPAADSSADPPADPPAAENGESSEPESASTAHTSTTEQSPEAS
jgi:hypothetical protein